LDNYFKRFENKTVSIEDIETTITRVYGTRFFEYVFYELSPVEGGKADLIVKMDEGAPGYISASLHYDGDYQGSIMLNGVFRNVLGNRSKLFTSLVLGTNPRFRMFYFISNGPKPGPGIELDFYSFKFEEYNKDEKTNSIRFINYKASVFINSIVDNTYSFRTGLEYEYFSFKTDIPDPLTDPLTDFNSYVNGFASFNADSRNKQYFSTSGFKSELKVSYIIPLGNNDVWTKELFTNSLMYYLKYDQNIPISNRFTLKPGVFAGGALKQDSPPIQHWYGVGGLMPINYQDNFVCFTGVKFVQSYGLYAAIARLKLQYNPVKNIYLTLRSDAGANELYLEDIVKSENFMIGYGLTTGYESFIGPIELTFMGSNQNPSLSIFVKLGFEF
ncbi:BamA/TamA family outer membrane protein, partial [Bacteroidota bacterium]